MKRLMIVIFLTLMVIGIGTVSAADTYTNTGAPVVTDTPLVPVTTDATTVITTEPTSIATTTITTIGPTIVPTAIITTEPLPVAPGDADLVDLIEGTVISTSDSNVQLNKGTVDFTLANSLTGISTKTRVDDVEFIPAATDESDKTLTWKSGEKFLFFFDDPAVTMTYAYTGPSLKETITLKSDKKLSVPISLQSNSTMSAIEEDKYKITSNTGNIIITKPVGIDAAGRKVDMNYVYQNGAMDLVYSKVAKDPKVTVNKISGVTPVNVVVTSQDVPITYPLIIESTTMDGNYTVENAIVPINIGNLAISDVSTGTIQVDSTQRPKTVQFYPRSTVKVSSDGEVVMQSNLDGNPVLEIYYGYQKSAINPWSYYYKVDSFDVPCKVVKSDYPTRSVQISYVDPALIRNIITSGKIPAREDLP